MIPLKRDSNNYRFFKLVLCVTSLSYVLFSFGGCSRLNNKDTVTSSSQLPTQTEATTTTSQTPEITTSQTTAVPSPVPTPVPEYVEPIYDEEIWYNGFSDPRSVRAEIVTNTNDILCVVNKYHALPLDYMPDDLVDAPHSYGQQLRSEACDAWIAMYDACYEATGEGLLLLSGYRDAYTQQYLFDRSVNLRGTPFACQKNAWPGRSEHQLGLAIDITPASETEILDEFATTTTGDWVNAHCYEYGFVLRYQADYTDSTGYGIEAWHYRYVGVEAATAMYEQNISLEDYMGCPQILPTDE